MEEDDPNPIAFMIKKGQQIAPQYKNFDCNTLSPPSRKLLQHLSIYSKLTPYLLAFFKSPGISMEVKISFLENNSMKLGADIFNKIEAQRVNYIYAIECAPYITGFCALAFTLLFAKYSALNKTLYKEMAFSGLAGFGIASGFIAWSKMKYYKQVNDGYYLLKQRMI